MMMIERWNRWEELLLGGAIVRHGTQNWDIVASELQTRIPHYVFTPQVCKVKYEVLKEHYSDSTSWFEELRKRRIAELKRDLVLSQNSIRLLESKIKSLKDDDETDNKENLCPEAENNQEIMLAAGSCDKYQQASNNKNIKQLVWNDKKKRSSGKRKRKDYSRYHNNGLLESSPALDMVTKETSDDDDHNYLVTSCEEVSTSVNNHYNKVMEDQSLKEDEVDFLLAILDSIMQNKEVASVFRHRLYSQKTRRYEKMIRRHMDLETIRYRIITKTIRSKMELFLDLHVVISNAFVFFPKNTREHRCGLILKDLCNPENDQ